MELLSYSIPTIFQPISIRNGDKFRALQYRGIATAEVAANRIVRNTKKLAVATGKAEKARIVANKLREAEEIIAGERN